MIDELDTHHRLSARTLRSLKPVGVIQELDGLLLAHYAVRVLMHEAALAVALDPDRLRFVHALEGIRDAIPEFQMTASEQWPALYRRLLADIAATRLPTRRARSNARVGKRKMSNFRLKRPDHYGPPRPTGSFQSAVAVLPTTLSRLAVEGLADMAQPILDLSLRDSGQAVATLDLRHPELCRI